MIEEEKELNNFYEQKEPKKYDWKAGRKFIAFILCLVAIIVMGILEKGTSSFPYIIGLYTAYITGNVVQKATRKESEK